MKKSEKRIVVAISGASGMAYAIRLLQSIPQEYKIHLVVSSVAEGILKAETGLEITEATIQQILSMENKKENHKNITLYTFQDHFAAIASGSYKTDGMVVIPCSMKTLAGIANGYANSLIERAADVTLKEKRKLVLVVRETPLNRIHLHNMLQANDAGATILPASPGFYHQPKTIDDLIGFIVARTLDALQIPQNLFHGWKEK